jgi:ubiquitin carboxyl-terminal hydrolase 4/11/15
LISIEIKQSGSLTPADQPISDEGDIVDQKVMTVDEDVILPTSPGDSLPIRVGTKKDIFAFKVQYSQKQWGTTPDFYAASKWESWEKRIKDVGDGQPFLMRDDGLICEFDENMKTFYFGDTRSQWDNSLFESWEEYIHPEYEAAIKASSEKGQKGISLQDCLDEFTKEERLGEDDLWYCPRCKKHQQATKKFDLWNTPDILVVHLKRFSNSRTLRDKIDAFIDFPVEGLDLKDMVRERAIAKNLVEQGTDISSLNLTNLDEPLIYDLFGVDEHMGGLGGGHYRAYALNHVNGQWYHFDDSFVSPANATDAVVGCNDFIMQSTKLNSF